MKQTGNFFVYYTHKNAARQVKNIFNLAQTL